MDSVKLQRQQGTTKSLDKFGQNEKVPEEYNEATTSQGTVGLDESCQVAKVWKNKKFSLTKKKNFVKSSHALVISIVKTLLSRNFSQKLCVIYTLTVWKNDNFSLTKKYFVKSINSLVISLVKTLLSRNFCKNVWD